MRYPRIDKEFPVSTSSSDSRMNYSVSAYRATCTCAVCVRLLLNYLIVFFTSRKLLYQHIMIAAVLYPQISGKHTTFRNYKITNKRPLVRERTCQWSQVSHAGGLVLFDSFPGPCAVRLWNVFVWLVTEDIICYFCHTFRGLYLGNIWHWISAICIFCLQFTPERDFQLCDKATPQSWINWCWAKEAKGLRSGSLCTSPRCLASYSTTYTRVKLVLEADLYRILFAEYLVLKLWTSETGTAKSEKTVDHAFRGKK